MLLFASDNLHATRSKVSQLAHLAPLEYQPFIDSFTFTFTFTSTFIHSLIQLVYVNSMAAVSETTSFFLGYKSAKKATSERISILSKTYIPPSCELEEY